MSRSLPAGHLCTIDVLMLTIAAFASYALRLERLDLGEHWRSFVLFAGIASVVVLMLFGMTRVYAQYWRYASFHEFSLLAWTLVCVGIIIILGYGENSVFAIHNELYRWSNTPRGESGVDGDGQCRSNCTPTLHTVIADIRFAERIHAVFEWYRPEIVFHAAAHKHVPLMEANPVEAATNNVLGTRNLLDAAIVTGVERFVMISTDKAVNPTSITSGSSKRAAELLVHHAAKVSGRAFMAVRFGNVLGSRGSVVWTFKQQIVAGGPVTVTHLEMRRYFMTIPEAVQLVLQAAALGRGDEVFTLDMGEPVKILDLARDMIELSGLQVGRDIDIAFVGLRPGEKLFEELFLPGEQYDRTSHEKIFIARNASRLVPADVLALIADLEEAALSDDTPRTVRLLRLIVQRSQLAPHEDVHGDHTLEPASLRALAVGGS